MRSQVPAAEFAERVLILYQKPFGDGKLFLRVPSGALPPGEAALLLTRDRGGEGLILWTLGPLVCEPMPAPKKLIDYLSRVKAGQDGTRT